MAQTDFDQTWVPRVGEKAARRLHRGDSMLLWLPVMFFIVTVALGALNGAQATSTFICALVTLAVWIVTFAVWMRSRILLAREMSEYLESKVTWIELPRMSPRGYDAWCRRRGITPPGLASEQTETSEDPFAAADGHDAPEEHELSGDTATAESA